MTRVLCMIYTRSRKVKIKNWHIILSSQRSIVLLALNLQHLSIAYCWYYCRTNENSLIQRQFPNERKDFMRDMLRIFLIDKMVAVEDKHFNIRDKGLEQISMYVVFCSTTLKTDFLVSSYELYWNSNLWSVPWCKKLPIPVKFNK